MKKLNTYAVEGSVKVLEEHQKCETETAKQIVQLGKDISIDVGRLDEYCFSSPNSLTYDLATLVGAVKCADRGIKRQHGNGWSRKINVEIPIIDKDIWNNSEIRLLLEDCLGFLTGDDWSFTFKSRKKFPLPPAQAHAIKVPDIPHVFIPYSHGLDSYAQMQILKHREPDVVIVCVHTDSKPNSKSWKEFCRSKPKGGVRALQIPVQVKEPHHAEPTFRTRPFMYYMFSAYGAYLTRSNKVIIPENGQGSLGGSLVPLGSEALHRSCHPGFTKRLSLFLEKLTGQYISFEHPALFQTKGQVMAELAEIDLNTQVWLDEHRSCSHDQRHGSYAGKYLHCGACGNCMLRRTSIKAAGIQDITPYKFSNLSVSKLEDAINDAGNIPRQIKSFKDLSGNSARSMQRLADLAAQPESSFIWSEAAGLSSYLDKDVKETHSRLMSLINTHDMEWSIFLKECGNHSWLTELARG